jgi:triosephosphate isomerase
VNDPVWIGTSWKMNKTLAEARDFVSALPASDSWPEGVQPFVIPPHTAIAAVRAALPLDSPVILGAQNAHWEPRGAYTGEVSMGMVADAGARLVELGHSERREYFNETDETVALKVRAAVDNGLIPLVCVGESEQTHDAGGAVEWIAGQVDAALSQLTAEERTRVLLAYEPIWAIGDKGRPAEPSDIADVMAMLAERYGNPATQPTPGRVRAVLYGGSVNQQNASELLGVPGVDGLFVGRSAWDPAGFLELVQIASVFRK